MGKQQTVSSVLGQFFLESKKFKAGGLTVFVVPVVHALLFYFLGKICFLHYRFRLLRCFFIFHFRLSFFLSFVLIPFF